MSGTVLCYGDSNTWGYAPDTGLRYPRDVRWPGVLQLALGTDYHVVEEGLNGRTTVWDDPMKAFRSGKDYLVPCLLSHQPVDLVVLMLGTNDLIARFSLSAYDVAQGAGVLVDMIGRSEAGPDDQAPQVLLIAPPPVGYLGEWAEKMAGAQEKSRRFSEQFRRVAEEYGCVYLDAGTIVQSSHVDGVHLDADQHQLLGRTVAGIVKDILK